MYDIDFVAEAREEDRVLDRNIAAADDGCVLLSVEGSVAGSAVGYAHAGICVFARNSELSVLSAHCEDDCPGFVCPHIRGDFFDFSAQIELRDGLCHEFRPEILGVLLHFHGQVGAADARKTRIIVNFICVDDLTAAHEVLLDDDEVELRAGRVDGCGHTGGAGTDDD